MSKRTITVTRPYDSVETFLEGDAWTVDRAQILLVGVDALPAETAVRFEISLSAGPAIVVGEGRVTEPVPAGDGRPGGLRVRLQKLNGASKDVLKRALDLQRRRHKEGGAAPGSSPVASPAPESTEPAAPPVAAKVVAAEEAKSGIRNRAALAAPPENRDALLARLRERAKTVKVEVFLEGRKASA